MGLWRSLDGLVTLELTSADIAGAVSAANGQNIEMFHLTQKDDLTMAFQIRRRDYNCLSRLSKKRGDTIRILGRSGLYWTGKGLLRRKLLLAGMAALLLLILFLPTRVLFVRVEGNVNVPARLILEKASECGIGFGASRREVRSEKMKNALLGAIPELQWAGVNTSGCTAVISVRERSDSESEEDLRGVSRIVAERDGIITGITVTGGNPLCTVGQAVKAGQTLISGYTDCGLTIQADRAQGEIFARTRRNLETITPAKYEKRTEETSSTKKYALIIGKKRINFYKDSGISGSTCVKMYKEICVTLPGGFQLPVRLVTEEWISWDTEPVTVDQTQARQLLEDFSESYLRGQMVAGVIETKEEVLARLGEAYCQQGHYDCLEMIGRERSEEIFDGKTD